MACHYDDARMDRFLAVHGSRGPRCPRLRLACSRPLAVEYGLALWLTQRAGCVRLGAGRTGGLEATQALFHVSTEEWPQRLMVNWQMLRGPILSIDRHVVHRLQFLHARPFT